MNEERKARVGLNYGSGAVLGLPLEAVENSLNTTAQNHVTNMLANNYFGHNETTPTSNTSFDRVKATFPHPSIVGSNCLNNAGASSIPAYSPTMARSENIYASCTSGSSGGSYLMEQAVFSWVYRDAGSAWGHRDAVLIQNISGNLSAPSTTTGYNNDRGSATSEGFLGVGVGHTASNTGLTGACPAGFYAHVVNLNIADPSADAACSFSVQADAFPVTLSYFSATPKPNYVSLNWETMGETNSSHFVVQRSRDLFEYENLGTVKSYGNSSERLAYEFFDRNPLSGTFYYRLKQVDFDGRFEYARPVVVNFDIATNDIDLRIYPNPSNGTFFVAVPENLTDTPNFRLSNIMGAALSIVVENTGKGVFKIMPHHNLPVGMYFLSVGTDGKIRNLKVTIQE